MQEIKKAKCKNCGIFITYVKNKTQNGLCNVCYAQKVGMDKHNKKVIDKYQNYNHYLQNKSNWNLKIRHYHAIIFWRAFELPNQWN